jgi:hypothetical protein
MAPDNAAAEFENRLRSRGLEVSRLTPDAGFSEAFAFYRDIRAKGCESKGVDGDMLLFQWGTYDWGKGKYFNLDLTRQFVLEGTEDDEGIFQLHLIFLYAPVPMLESLAEGNRWCRSPAELQGFETFVRSSSAYRAALLQTSAKVELSYEAAG